MSDTAQREVSRAEFARMVNVSRAAVTLAVKSHRFDMQALGEGTNLRLPWALQQWNANKDQRGYGLRAGDDEEFDDDDELPASGEAAPPAPGSVAAEKARAYSLRADKLQIEVAERRGELIERDGVVAGLQEAGAKIAADLDAITAWAEELAAVATGDVAAMRAALKTKVRKLRDALATRLDKALEADLGGDDAHD